jgi:hypothetical protein
MTSETTIIKIDGGDYANWHFQAFGDSKKIVQEMNDEGVLSKTFDTPEGKYNVELLTFGFIDPNFIKFISSYVNESDSFGIYGIPNN